ncbi:diguanylate cyclase domain-containing protein [Aliivibrio wodanis]|uniref:diguanylate cyclase domain-containing protein n=1 Tax=Aliivibrio wodanis TaxID=80852 RepID=UPI00406C225D
MKILLYDKIKWIIAFLVLLIVVFLTVNKIKQDHAEYDRETVKYIELIKASYWASWRFGREVQLLELEIMSAIHNGHSSQQKILDRIDYLIVNYEFLATDTNVFKNIQGYVNRYLDGHIINLDNNYELLLSNDNWESNLPSTLVTVRKIKDTYDDMVLYEFKGYDLTEFVNKIKDDRQDLLYYIYIALIAATITMPALTYMSKSLRAKSKILETDYLTGLKNRKYCMSVLKTKIARGNNIAFCFIDLNGFKEVNDTLGHDAGDQLLKIIASRIPKAIKKGDTFARLGGDEFGLILDGCTNESDIVSALVRIMTMISEPMKIEEKIITVGCSSGIAINNSEINSSKNLIAAADLAMYDAKKRKHTQTNVYEFYRGVLS